MQQESFHYHTCIIHLWKEQPVASQTGWRFSLSSSSTATRRGFLQLEALLDDLKIILETLTESARLGDSPQQAKNSPETSTRPE